MRLTDGDYPGPKEIETEIDLGTDDTDHETYVESGLGSCCESARVIEIETA